MQYLPVQAALREWKRLLVPGGFVGFSAMREGFPIAAQLFRDHARRYGLTLDDPAAPLGTTGRCIELLRAAGITPTDTIVEPIQFAPGDLNHAWEAHAFGPHHHAVSTLASEQASAFQQEYTNELTDVLSSNADAVLNPEVIYAFGRKHHATD